MGNTKALITQHQGEFHHQNYTFGSVHEVCRPLLSSETLFTLFTRHNIVCLTPFWKISTTNHFTVLENCWLLNVELFWLSSFLGTTVSYGSFQGLSTRLKKQAKTTISNTQRPSTIGTSKLLLWDEIDILDDQNWRHTQLHHNITVRELPQSIMQFCIIFPCYVNIIKSCLNAPWGYGLTFVLLA